MSCHKRIHMSYTRKTLALLLCATLILPAGFAYADEPAHAPTEPISQTEQVPEDASQDAENTTPVTVEDTPETADASPVPPADVTDDTDGDDASASGKEESTFDESVEDSDGLSTQGVMSSAAPLEPKTYLIRPASSAERVLDISSASKTDGAHAILYSSHLGANQRFTFTLDDKTGLYTIVSVASNKVLDVSGARKAASTQVLQYRPHGGVNQKWALEQNRDGSYTIVSALDKNLVLDVSGSQDKDSTKIIIYTRRQNAKNQSFFLIPTTMTPPQPGNLNLEAGVFSIQDRLSPARVLDVAGASTTIGTAVVLWNNNGTQHQRFSFSRDASGLYAIRPLHAGGALGTQVPARQVVQLPYVSTSSTDISYLAQRWVLLSDGAGSSIVRFKNAATGLYLDVQGADPSAGTSLIVYASHSGVNQSFTLKRASAHNLAAGIYTLSPRSAPSKRIDIQGSSTDAGASAILWTAHNGQNQKFEFVNRNDGSWALAALSSGQRLTDVSGAIRQTVASTSDDQAWEPLETLGGVALKNRATGRYLAIDGKGNVLAKSLTTSTDPFAVDQTCLFVFAWAPVIENGYYFISNQAQSNSLLDVSGSSRSPSANVLLWNRHGRANQIWQVTRNADGTYWVTSALSRLRLDVRGSEAKSGTNVLQYTPHSNANQKWYILPAGDGSYHLRSALGATLYLGTANGSTASGSNVVIHTANGSPSQRFSFEATGDIKEVRLDVPLLLQVPEFPTGCEAASVAMMLRYAGYNVSVADIVRAMPYHSSNPNLGFVGNPRTWSGVTIYPPALLGTVRSYAGSAVDLTGASLETFETYLKAGHPIACWIRYGSGLHCVAVTGYDEKNFYYNDPYGGKDKAVSRANFASIRASLGNRALSY
jgi:uncharacterized protein YvpB